MYIYIIWLVVWNMFPYIGNNIPSLLIFSEGLKPPIRCIHTLMYPMISGTEPPSGDQGIRDRAGSSRLFLIRSKEIDSDWLDVMFGVIPPPFQQFSQVLGDDAGPRLGQAPFYHCHPPVICSSEKLWVRYRCVWKFSTEKLSLLTDHFTCIV